MRQIFKNGVNPDPITPPPPTPGERSAKSYYHRIKGYKSAAINVVDYPPIKNETALTYHRRLQNQCLKAERNRVV